MMKLFGKTARKCLASVVFPEQVGPLILHWQAFDYAQSIEVMFKGGKTHPIPTITTCFGLEVDILCALPMDSLDGFFFSLFRIS
jgi:hypothetical protein